MGGRPLALVALLHPVPSEIWEAKVVDYWSQSRGWKWEELDQFLPATTLLHMAPIMVSERMEERDRLAWEPIASGEFSVRSVYTNCCNWGQVWFGMVGECVWKLQVQQRARTFMRLLAHNQILSNSARWKRGFAESMRCVACSATTSMQSVIVRTQ